MRRTATVVLAVVVALAGSIGVIAFFQSRDDSQLDTTAGGPGVAAPEATEDRLRRGNVVLTFRAPADGRRLRAIADEVAGPAEPSLVDAGQAVLVERRADQAEPVAAHAYRRRLAGNPPDDEVRRFIEFWLGRGESSG